MLSCQAACAKHNKKGTYLFSKTISWSAVRVCCILGFKQNSTFTFAVAATYCSMHHFPSNCFVMAVNWEDTGHTRPPEAPAKELVHVLNGSPRDVIPGSFPSSFSVSCPDVENNVNSVVTVCICKSLNLRSSCLLCTSWSTAHMWVILRKCRIESAVTIFDVKCIFWLQMSTSFAHFSNHSLK